MSDWIIGLIADAGYAGVAFLMFLETIIPPIPSEVIMPLAGISAAHGQMSLTGVILAGSGGAMAGNFVWYLLARMIGIERFRPFLDRYGRWLTFDWAEVKKLEALFDRWGGPIVGFARMTPNARSLISVPAGLVRMKLPTFLFWSSLGTIGWSSGLALAGYLLGRHFERIDRILAPLSLAVTVLVILVYVWRQLTWKSRHEG